MEDDDWPECAVEGCSRKTYSEGGSRYCFPHSRDSDTHAKHGDAQQGPASGE